MPRITCIEHDGDEPDARLAGRIRVRDDLDGLVVRMPRRRH